MGNDTFFYLVNGSLKDVGYVELLKLSKCRKEKGKLTATAEKKIYYEIN